jgi:LDH2 family malate/lactate/ureidoglycolate dehydrogenase
MTVSETLRPVRHEELLVLVTEIFVRCGMHESDGLFLATTLVEADLRGVHSHGVLRVPEYVKKLTVGGVDPCGTPSVVRDFGACQVVDGGNSMGQIGVRFAMEQAIARSAATGIAAVAVRGSNHCGALANYALQAVAHDTIGLVTTNALPTMAPWGGARRLLGINPLGVGIPAGDEWPIIYDAAFSASAHGKIRVYQQRGQPLPERWALDADGRPTIDPAAAIDGLLLPIGDFKGANMAFVMGILSSMLSGASYGTELGDMYAGPRAGQDGQFVAAIQIAAFEDPARFKARVDAAVQEMHATTLAPGFDRVYAPGEKEFLCDRNYRAHGIPLTRQTLEDVIATARGLGIADISVSGHDTATISLRDADRPDR